MMKQYASHHVPMLSFFSKALYRDVCLRWKGTGFAYLLLLLAVCWIAPMVKLHVQLGEFVDNDAPPFVSQIPTLSIVNGKASIREPQPYYIKDPDTGETQVVIDTTGSITSLADTEARVLVTATQVVFQKNDIETRTFELEEVKDFTLDQALVTDWLSKLKKFTAPVLYPLAVLLSFVGRIIQLLIYAAIGLVLASWCHSERGYVELLRLAVVAVTPCIIIRTVVDITEVTIPLAGLWYFLVAMGYLFFGIKAAAAEETPAEG